MTRAERGVSRAGADPGGEPTFEELAERVDEAVRRIGTLTGEAREIADEVKAAVEAVHRAGLVAMVRRMRRDGRARQVLFELVDEPVVRLLLSLHGIIRPGTQPNESSPTLVPLDMLWAGPDRVEDGWVRTGPVDRVAEGEITLLELVARSGRETEAIVVRLGGTLTAYRNACAHQGLPLEAAILDTEAGTLTCPWHGYCFDATSGACLSAPDTHLEQLPLQVDHGQLWIRVGT